MQIEKINPRESLLTYVKNFKKWVVSLKIYLKEAIIYCYLFIFIFSFVFCHHPNKENKETPVHV
jgi:hypothetical protein